MAKYEVDVVVKYAIDVEAGSPQEAYEKVGNISPFLINEKMATVYDSYLDSVWDQTPVNDLIEEKNVTSEIKENGSYWY